MKQTDDLATMTKAPRRNWPGTVGYISQPARIVVTDARVIINLIHVDRLNLLGALPAERARRGCRPAG